MIKEMSKSDSDSITFEEFFRYMTFHHLIEKFDKSKPLEAWARQKITVEVKKEENKEEEDEEEDEEEEPEIPEDIKELPYKEQQREIIKKSFIQMGIGLLLVLVFSDPMVEILNALGGCIKINTFYIGFTLAPIASNGSELLAAYTYSKKQTTKSIQIAHSTCLGAGCMNNTFCLAIFLLIIATNGFGTSSIPLKWAYSAETVSIIIIELILVLTLLLNKHTMLVGILILILYPISILLVIFMENVLKWD